MEFLGFDWRDGVLLLAVAAAVYLLVMVLRLAALRRRPAAAARNPPAAEAPAQPAWPDRWDVPATPAEPAPASTEGQPATFADHLAGTRLDLEVRQLREEVLALRRELGELKAARRVSPQYADAMALARRGYDAQGIAAECGIAVAEAELVLALSRDRVQFDNEVDDGGRSPAGQ